MADTIKSVPLVAIIPLLLTRVLLAVPAVTCCTETPEPLTVREFSPSASAPITQSFACVVVTYTVAVVLELPPLFFCILLNEETPRNSASVALISAVVEGVIVYPVSVA